MKRSRTILVTLLVVFIGLGLAKNLIARAALTGAITAITGFPAQVGGLRLGLLGGDLHIRNLRVLNPRGYGERVFVDVPELYVNLDPGALLRGKIHVEEMRLNLRTLNVVKASSGDLNLHKVKALAEGGPKASGGAPAPPAGKLPDLQVDVLELKVGGVSYTDESHTPPTVQAFAVNIDERYEHITNPYLFAGLVVSRALTKTTISSLANFDVRALQASVTQGLKLSADKLTGTVVDGAEAAKKIGQNAVGTAKGAVQQTADSFKRLLGQ